jgi:nicotinamide riboside transporter PnuC
MAGHWSNGHFIAVVLHLGWTYIVGLLFVNLYFYIFNQQRLWADGILMPHLHKALPVGCNYLDSLNQ